MDDITVRKMKPSEKIRVQELFESVYKCTLSGAVPVFENATQGEEIFVALYSGIIVGIATVWIPDAFVHYLFVDQEIRHKGVGRAMIERLAEQYESPLTLKCLIENKEAMAFYHATGWHEVETGYSEEGAYALLRYAPAKPSA